MSQLQAQLRKIAATAKIKQPKGSKPSLLFDPRKAAETDLETIYSLGVNGLAELTTHSAEFRAFEQTLFSPKSKETERLQLTTDENAALDEQILAFLRLLSPYFLLKPAHKALEYLIRRFRINEYNVDGIMECIMMYHETTAFVRMVKILDLNLAQNKRWYWLEVTQKSGAPMDRAAWIQRCVTDQWLLSFVGDAMTRILATKKSTGYVGFWASTVVGTIEVMPTIPDSVLNSLLPYLIQGLKSNNGEYTLAVYMVLAAVCKRVTLADTLTQSLLDSIGQNIKEETAKPALMCLAYICKTQDLAALPAKCFRRIVNLPDFAWMLASLCKQYDCGRLMRLLLASLVDHLPKHTDFIDFFAAVLDVVPLSSELARYAGDLLLEYFARESKSEGVDMENLSNYCTRLLKLLATKYPTELDGAISHALKKHGDSKATGDGKEKDKSSKKLNKRLFELLSKAFMGTRHQPLVATNTTVFMSLHHPEPKMRELAVQQLGSESAVAGEDAAFVAGALLERLRDDSPDVVLAALRAFPAAMEHAEADAVFEGLALLARNEQGNRTRPIVSAAMSLLAGPFLKAFPDYEDKVLPFVLCFLVPSHKTQRIAAALAKSLSSSDSPLKGNPIVAGLPASLLAQYEALEQEEGDGAKISGKKSGKGERDSDGGSKLAGAALVSLVVAIATSVRKDAAVQETLLACLNDSAPTSVVSGMYGWHLKMLVSMTMVAAAADITEFPWEALRVCVADLAADLRTWLQQAEPSAITLPARETSGQLPSAVLGAMLKYGDGNKAGRRAHALAAAALCLLREVVCVTPVGESLSAKAAALLLDVFGFIGGGSGAIEVYQPLVGAIFAHIPPAAMLPFLSLTWLHDSDRPTPAVLQVRALHIAATFLQTLAGNSGHVTKVPNRGALANAVALFVPALVAAMLVPVAAVRVAALRCLATVATLPQELLEYNSDAMATGNDGLELLLYTDAAAIKAISAAQNGKLVAALLEAKEEFVADSNYLGAFITRALNNSAAKKYNGAVVMFLASFAAGLRNGHVRYELLDAMRSFADTPVTICVVLPLIKALIEKGEYDLKKKTLSELELRTLTMLVMLFNENALPLLNGDAECMETFLAPLKGGPGQVAVIRQITPDFFAKASAKSQKQMLAALMDVQYHPAPHSAHTAAKKCIAELPLTATHIKAEIDRSGFLAEASAPVASRSGPAKRARVGSDAGTSAVPHGDEGTENEAGELDREAWAASMLSLKRLAGVLELLLHKKDVGDEQRLVDRLFECLARCVDLTDDPRPTLEYIKQLSLLAIAGVLSRMKDMDAAVLGPVEKSVNVELVVQCVRVTENPQTHHHALMLLAEIAKLFPERVLHNIMAIFTFMGTNVMRQDDNYSFHVIQQSIETVIPPLVAASPANPGAVADMALGVIKVFVNAFSHIPRHRRLRLFTHLVTTLGPKDNLYITVALLLERGTRAPTEGGNGLSLPDEEGEADVPVAELARTVMQQFGADVQTAALCALANVCVALPNHKPTGEKEEARMIKETPNTALGIFDFRVRTDKQLRSFKLECARFIGDCLGSRSFLGAVRAVDKTKDTADDAVTPAALQAQYLRLLEALLSLIRSVGAHQGTLTAQPVSKSTKAVLTQWREVIARAYEAIDRLCALLSLPTFVAVLADLIKHNDSAIRCKALRLFSAKIEQHKDMLSAEEVLLFVSMVDGLLEIINAADSDPDAANVKQTALLNLEILAHSFAADHPAAFVKAIPVVIGDSVLGSANSHVRASAFVCLGSLIGTLGPKAIAYLPRFVPQLLRTMQDLLAAKRFGSSGLLLLRSAMSALSSCLNHVPQFLSPYLTQLLQITCNPVFVDENLDLFGSDLNAAAVASRKAQMADLRTKAEGARTSMASTISARELLPAVFTAYTEYTQAKQGEADNRTVSAAALKALLNMLAQATGNMTRADVTTYYKHLFKFYLGCFDYRSLSGAVDVNDVESCGIEAFVAMVMKLSESSFKPLFLKLVSWHKADAARRHARQQLFFRLLDALAAALKNIFVPYFKYVVADCVEVLETLNSAKAMGEVGAAGTATEEACELLDFTLAAVHKCFLYDSDGVVSKEVFAEVYGPLVDQIENEFGGSDVYQARVNERVTPAVAQLALAVHDDAMWKKLNHSVLLKTRHHEAQVRIAALKTVNELYARLGEEYLILLPETIPFLAECMEDETPEVEAAAQDVIATIESFLGESLQKYF